MGKDMLPFALAVATNKAQLMFVPFVALIENIIHEGSKFRCNVVKFADIGRTIDIPTAAATADIVVCSYEHASRAIRLSQELLSRGRLGWLFINEAHVVELDGAYRDFSSLHEICTHCPQVCCMTATLQTRHQAGLAAKLGRVGFSKSILFPPERPQLKLVLKITTDARGWIAEDLNNQPSGQKALVFCLFKKVVPEMSLYLKSILHNREIMECVSGVTADLVAFRRSDSGVMVCTSVLATGVSVENITRVYFLGCAHGPESFLQGAGRGARSDQEKCVATMVTTKRDLAFYQDSKLSSEH
jgi:superfamily II DNA helicase RecQ